MPLRILSKSTCSCHHLFYFELFSVIQSLEKSKIFSERCPRNFSSNLLSIWRTRSLVIPYRSPSSRKVIGVSASSLSERMVFSFSFRVGSIILSWSRKSPCISSWASSVSRDGPRAGIKKCTCGGSLHAYIGSGR